MQTKLTCAGTKGQTILVSIVLPAFNEEQGISRTLQSLCEEPRLLAAEIIVVDDGSTDATAEKVLAFPRVNLVRHHTNKGYGAALVTGTREATGKYVIWFDADGQHRVEDLLSVAGRLLENDLDYCIGIRDAASHQVSSRLIGKWILRKVVQFAAGQSVRDYNSGLRGFRRKLINRYLHLLPKGFGASTTTTLILLEQFHRGDEIPITVLERIGKSSVRQFRDGMRTLLLILRIFLIFKPLHFFGGTGFLLSIAGLGYGLWSALTEGLGFPVLAAVVLLFGVQTIFLGLIMDQISAMRRERFE